MRSQPLIGRCHWQSAPKIVKGRKDYRCCECNIILGKGSTHQYVSGIWGNSNLEFRTCLNCADRWKDLIIEHYGFDFTPFNHGDLNEAIACLELQEAIVSLDCDRLAKAIKEYKPFANSPSAREDIELAENIILQASRGIQWL